MAREETGHDALLQRILENLSTSVLLFGRELGLLYMNPSAEMLMELSCRRAVGNGAEQLLPGNDHLIGIFRRALETGHPLSERELHMVLPGGREVTVDCTVTPVADQHSASALLVEISPLDRQLRIAREETLLAQHHATRDVIRGLAHEIKNPLGGLRGAAQLLRHELHDEALKEYTSIIIGEADRLQSLLDRMLGPNALPRKRRVNIHEQIERVRQLVQAEAPPTIEIERDYDPSVPELHADPDMLIQALLNLVRNAVQAVGERGRIVLRTRTRRQITIGSRRHKLVASIEIIDDGPGIAPEMLDKIFFPMVTGRAEGTGLGLPIAQSLINRHQGLIECESQPGRTVFTILIPLESSNE